jgi:arylsulfatase A-like enzyme
MQVTDFYQPAPEVTRTGLDWMTNNNVPEDIPFYFFLHYMDPHDPYMAPESKEGGYARARMEHPDVSLEGPMRDAYIREIEYFDGYLGKFFDGLKERGLYDDTLIIFTSDHGEEFHEHGGWWHGFTLYDEQTHVPFMMKLPGGKLAGTVTTDLARHIDIAPTVLQYAGLEAATCMPGLPLVDTAGNLANGAITYTYAENNFEGIDLQAVRTLDMKLIKEIPSKEGELPPLEMYDLSRDAGEIKNLADETGLADPDNQLNSGELLLVIEGYQSVIHDCAAEPSADVNVEDAEEQLEALGYL